MKNEQSEQGQLREHIVLIVDDNENNLQIAAKIVHQAGYQVLLASDGKSALEILQTVVPDAILLDIMMPGMSGLEVCETIQRTTALTGIPVIFLSAVGEDAMIEEGLVHGGVDYITKPFRERILCARLRLHIERGIYQKEIIRQKEILTEKNKALIEVQEQLIHLNAALERQIEKNLAIFAGMNDMIRNPLAVAMSMLEMNDHPESDQIISQLERIDAAVDDLDKGFLASDKVLSYLKKHYHICE
ncbi:response regulator [Methanospirillum hungatei]|uniref:response regulator n=1 Tax=Methanospirillum hungatei TaxID=2203 RepID=UPI0026EA2ABC|nr:response regulator [Methanospirillum hungatei]MCA1915039.1 response regulator [Methanospirillum hungatei]